MIELCSILLFGGHFVFQKKLFSLSIRTSMQNLDSVAQEMSELCLIFQYGGHFVFQNFVKKWVSYAQFCYFVFQNFVKICSDCPYDFHAQSGVCSSKNERVMALGTKEDKHLSIIYIQVIIRSKLHFSYSRRQKPK